MYVQASRAVLGIVSEKFPAMPFTLRALAEEGEKAKEPVSSAQVGGRLGAWGAGLGVSCQRQKHSRVEEMVVRRWW
jgi:hypothetical protein